MKIKIQTESGEKERNWYICDLDCYTPEFLQQIILSLYYESPNKSPQLASDTSEAQQGETGSDTIQLIKGSDASFPMPDTKQELNKEISKDYG